MIGETPLVAALVDGGVADALFEAKPTSAPMTSND
jgi:hypothetical protein